VHVGVDDQNAGQLVTFEYVGRSLKTRPEAMVYRYRLTGLDEDWKRFKSAKDFWR